MSNALHKAKVIFGFADEDELTAEVAPKNDRRDEPAERNDHSERTHAPKARATVTPLRAQQQVGAMDEILTVHPRQYKDAQAIADAFRDGTPVIINLSQMTDGDARRLIDFSAGLTQGLGGRIDRVTTKVYLLTPESISVSGSHLDDSASESPVFAH